jgi:peptidoglycan hydrolase CwlO-like protein
MKKIRLLSLSALLFPVALVYAQRPVTITEESISFKGAEYPGFVVSIPEFIVESAQKNWIKELQSGTKSKVVTENNQMTITGANIKAISPAPINIYSHFAIRDSVLNLSVTFEISSLKYVEKANGEDEVAQAREFLKKYAKDQYVDKVEEELKTDNKNLKDLQKQLESVQSKKLSMQKSIQSNKTDIAQANNDITIQKGEIEKLTKEIIDQNNQLVTMEKGTVKDEKVKYVKDIEKRKKKAFNEIESLEKSIVKMNSEITNYEDQIVTNDASQEELKGKIADQELVVKKCKEKLEKIEAS